MIFHGNDSHVKSDRTIWELLEEVTVLDEFGIVAAVLKYTEKYIFYARRYIFEKF